MYDKKRKKNRQYIKIEQIQGAEKKERTKKKLDLINRIQNVIAEIVYAKYGIK